jgi:hypothetical protein
VEGLKAELVEAQIESKFFEKDLKDSGTQTEFQAISLKSRAVLASSGEDIYLTELINKAMRYEEEHCRLAEEIDGYRQKIYQQKPSDSLRQRITALEQN